MNGFLQHLKQRKLVQWAIAYGAAAFALLQGVDIVAQQFGWPETVRRGITLALVVGFFVTLVLAWYHGERGAQRVTGTELLILALLLALGGGFLWRFAGMSNERIVRSGMPSLAIASSPAPIAIPEKSIAVLPFENLSSDKENAFFTDGVQDEILTDLAKVADLKVISRTSVMQYRDAAVRNSRKIGQELGVAHLLEGSVQRAGGKVRVNAQLIDARTDAHLWGQTYDRDLKDVFAIQSEIAETIADQLEVRLSPNERKAIERAPTNDITAHNLYVRARQLDDLVNSSDAKKSLLEAISLLEEAVERDPNYYLAYALMVEVHTDLYWGGFDPNPERLELARAALDKAESIAPDAGEVHFEKGTYLYHGLRDYDGARAELEIAAKLLPNSARVPMILGAIDRRQARWDDAVRNFQHAVRTDPREGFIYEETGSTFVGLRRYGEAKSYLKRASVLSPTDYFAGATLAQLPYFERGETSGWRNHLLEVQKAGHSDSIPIFFADCALAERDQRAAEEALKFFPPEGATDSVTDINWPRDWFVGLVARSFGDEERARAAFTAARSAILPMTQQLPDYPGGWILLGLIDAGLGNREAIAEGKRAGKLLPLSKDAWDGPGYVTNLALIYTWLGEKDLALEQLALSARIPAGISYGELELSPKWDALRGDPRFDKIMASVAPKTIGGPVR
jgi:TolB-like protein